MKPSHLSITLRRLGPLTLGAFAIGVDASVLSGILLDISAGLRASPGTVGTVLALFPLVYAIAAPVVATATGSWSRRRVATVGMLVFAAGNVVAAAGTIELLAAGRVVAALGACAYLPNAVATAAASVPTERSGRAVSIVLAGTTAAAVLGVPAGVLLAAVVGWPWVLVAVAALGLGAAALQSRHLANPPSPGTGLRARLAPLRDRGALLTLATTVVAVSGEYVVYAYLALVVATVIGPGAGVLVPVLAIFGLATVGGTILGGVLADRHRHHPRRLLLIVLGAVGALLLALPWTHAPAITIAVLILWGLIGWTIVPTQLRRLMHAHPTATPLVASLNSSAVFLAVALGGLLGGWAADRYGVVALCALGAALVWCAAIFLPAPRRSRVVEQSRVLEES